jgi:hypothetical protein
MTRGKKAAVPENPNDRLEAIAQSDHDLEWRNRKITRDGKTRPCPRGEWNTWQPGKSVEHAFVGTNAARIRQKRTYR